MFVGIFHENKMINVPVEFDKYHGINFYSMMFYEIVRRIPVESYSYYMQPIKCIKMKKSLAVMGRYLSNSEEHLRPQPQLEA